MEPTAARHFPSLSHGFDLKPQVHMFSEDMHLSVMPIRGKTEKQTNFKVTLSGDDDERKRASKLIRKFGELDRHDLDEIVCDAVINIAKHLTWEGCAIYEITRDNDGVIDIYGFTTKRLVMVPGLFIQIIPRADWQHWGKKLVLIPANKIFYLKMPAVLGGCKGYKRILKRLGAFEHLGPLFFKKDLESGIQTRAFDFQMYVRNCDIYYRRITRNWGWNVRDWSQERSTEFFNFYKKITSHWAQAVLREYIIAELNRLFSRLGIVCQIEVTGLPAPSEILYIRRQLLEGTITFKQASDKVSLL